jgi:iron complex outermembrane receptor protein
LEIDLTGRPLKGLNILAGYSYNFMRYTQTPDTPGSYLVGDRIVNIPDHTANASIWYEFNDKKLRGLSLGVSAKYIGERLAGWNRTVGGNKQPFSVPGFTTVDLSMGYSYKRFSFIGKISNINNTLNYYVHENYSVNPITPRQFSTTLSYKL